MHVVFAASPRDGLRLKRENLQVVLQPSATFDRIEPFHQLGVLGGDPCRTLVGVAFERLDAAESEHHRPRCITHVSARSQGFD